MRFVDEGFLLLLRSGRTPHALPTHRGRGDPDQLGLREELEQLNRLRQPDRVRVSLRTLTGLAATVAGARRRGGQLDA